MEASRRSWRSAAAHLVSERILEGQFGFLLHFVACMDFPLQFQGIHILVEGNNHLKYSPKLLELVS